MASELLLNCMYFAIFVALKESITLNLAQRSSKVIDFGTNQKQSKWRHWNPDCGPRRSSLATGPLELRAWGRCLTGLHYDPPMTKSSRLRSDMYVPYVIPTVQLLQLFRILYCKPNCWDFLYMLCGINTRETVSTLQFLNSLAEVRVNVLQNADSFPAFTLYERQLLTTT